MLAERPVALSSGRTGHRAVNGRRRMVIEVPPAVGAARRPRRRRRAALALALLVLSPALLLSPRVRCAGYAQLVSFGDEDLRTAGLNGLDRNGAAGRRALLGLAAEEVRSGPRLRAFGGPAAQTEPLRIGPLQWILGALSVKNPSAVDELCTELERGGDLQLLLPLILAASVEEEILALAGVPVVVVEHGEVYEIPWRDELVRADLKVSSLTAAKLEADGHDGPVTVWFKARVERALLRRLRRASREAPGEVRTLVDSLHLLELPGAPLQLPGVDFHVSEIDDDGPFTVRALCRLYEDTFGETAILSPAVRARLDQPVAGPGSTRRDLLAATRMLSFEFGSKVGGDPAALALRDLASSDLIVNRTDETVPEILTVDEAAARWLAHADRLLGADPRR